MAIVIAMVQINRHSGRRDIHRPFGRAVTYIVIPDPPQGGRDPVSPGSGEGRMGEQRQHCCTPAGFRLRAGMTYALAAPLKLVIPDPPQGGSDPESRQRRCTPTGFRLRAGMT